MEATASDELSRLQAVQARVRTLVAERPGVSDAIRAAFDSYLGLGSRFRTERAAVQQRQNSLARALLAQGRLLDPVCRKRPTTPCLRVHVWGLCPAALAQRLEAAPSPWEGLPADLEREAAASALAALDRDRQYQSHSMPSRVKARWAKRFRREVKDGRNVSFRWTIIVARPKDLHEPLSPHTLDRKSLSHFADEDYRIIALYWLGGLADLGAIRPIVPEPQATGDLVHDAAAHSAWRGRFPSGRDPAHQSEPQPDPRMFPADIAEQMLGVVERWIVTEHAARRDLPTDDYQRRNPITPTTPPGELSSVRASDECRESQVPVGSPQIERTDFHEQESAIRNSPRTCSVSPDLVAKLDAVVEETRAGFEHVKGVIETLRARDDGPSPTNKPKPTRRERRAKWLAEAMLTVRDHPEWPDATIAEQVGIHKSRLSRSPEYQAAARMARKPRAPDGFVANVDKDRTVEAVDDSFDPNRPASRQWRDEEDTDDRIDREMRERNQKRNGERNPQR